MLACLKLWLSRLALPDLGSESNVTALLLTALAKAPPGSASTPSSIEESRCLELLFPTF